MTEQTPAQPHPAELELARLRAGLTAGLTVEQSARLNGATAEELATDAASFAAELNAANPTWPAPLVGGSRGTDVGSATGVAAGANLYRERQGITDDGQRPGQTTRRAFTENTYSMETR
ncbi:hypothetical protein [Streptomyces sp. NPDC058249]|uniref:hypothetical protein n=1 Tax=Streptomyces sp. NPDC058249 TaxID=3346403 RepID=UPI0036E64210